MESINTIIITNFISILLYLIPIVAFISIFKTSWFKGVIGEFIINVSAKLFLNNEDYHLIKNVTLPTDEENGSTQIDHIIVSKYGVFVVETKNMKGWIFGKPKEKMWTQKIYKHNKKFQNPLRQNYKHIKVFKSLLELSEEQLHSLIVFVGDSKFKTKMPANVTYGMGYIKFIKSKKQPVLEESEVKRITEKIEEGRLQPSLKTNKEHVKHVKNKLAG